MNQIHKIKGSLLILASSVMFSVMTCLVKTISTVNVFRTTFIRFAIGLLILCVLVSTTRIRLRFTNWGLLLLNGVLSCFGITITYLVIVKIGVSKSTVILYSYPVFASLFGAYFLKEHLRWINFAALAAAVIGLYLHVTRVNGLEGFFHIGLYECVALAGMMIYALFAVIIRKLHETETSYEIFFAQCAIGVALLIVPAKIGSVTIGWLEVLILLAIGVLATYGQLTMTQGFRYLPVKVASLLTMSQLIFNYTAGILIFDESLTARAFVGSTLIFAACFMALLAGEKT
ncbi:MAG: DMT family transporter [Anaerohalosphaeraceae bacterium]|jgi:drug/metabolite transporter (DMT)-like permease